MSDIALLKRAHVRMNKALQAAWAGRDTSLPYKTPEDLLTMASIVEKETAVPEERKGSVGVRQPLAHRHASADRSDGDLRHGRKL